MCSPHAPNTSRQQAEAARQAQAEEARYAAQLAAQQTQWEAERVDSERRYQQQLAMQQTEIARQAEATKATEAASAAANQKKVDDAAAVTARGRSYAEFRDAELAGATGKVNDSFAGFNPDYFSGYADKFVAANRVDADHQYERGTRTMKYKLADNRNLNSSAAADAFGELDQDHNSTIAKISAAGSDRAAALASQVGQQKNAALNSLLALGASGVPDFQTDEDAATAKSRLGSQLLAMGNNIRTSVPAY